MRYKEIYKNYESNYDQFGDTPMGVGWPKEKDCNVRFKVMSEVFGSLGSKVSVLDFGCGLSHFYKYLINENLSNKVEYIGLDISEKYIEKSKIKYPDNCYYCRDILKEGFDFDFDFDYAVLNGVFTQKFSLSQDEMFEFFKSIIKKVYHSCEKGIAFNVMSDCVDFKKDGAFHLPLSELCDFIVSDLTRDFVVRHDYGLYEYTVYVFKKKRLE